MRNKVLATVSMGARTAGAAVVFLIIGRALGPEQLGKMSLFLAYAGIMVLLADYGLGNPALRGMSLDVDKAGGMLTRYVWARIILGALVLAGGSALLMALGQVSEDDLPLFLVIAVGTFAAAHGDFILLFFRATTRYAQDAAITIATTAVHLVGVGLVAFVTRDLMQVSVAFTLSRLLYMASAASVARACDPTAFRGLNAPFEAARTLPRLLSQHRYYATDSVITAAFNQLDTIAVSHIFGLHAAGLYQVGARVVQMSLTLVQIMTAVYVPQLTRELQQSDTPASARRMIWELSLIGVAAGIGMVIVMPWVIDLLFGAPFEAVNSLWAGFALVIVIRCIGAGFGILLIALDQPRLRTVSQSIVLATFGALSLWVLPVAGFSAVPLAIAAAIASGVSVYILALMRGRPALFRSILKLR